MTSSWGRALLVASCVVACAGDNGNGPDKEPEEFTRYSAVAASFNGGCGVTLTGGVNCWGSRIDDFTTIDSVPVPAALAEARTTVTGALRLRCGVGVSGRIYCYGSVTQEDIGYSFADAQLSTTWDTRAASMGGNHGCAIGPDSTAWCWGSSLGGKRGVPWPTMYPPTLANLTLDSVRTNYKFLAISAANWHTCAITTSHEVACWGDSAAVGGAPVPYSHEDNPCRGTVACTATPVLVPGITNVVSLSSAARHSCAVAGGEVVCWGTNANGQLGSGTTDSPTPVVVPIPGNVVEVSAGAAHACARTAAMQVYCWGQVDDGDPIEPTLVPGNYPAFTTISAGGNSTCGLTADGAIYCWGRGSALGSGTGRPSARPVRIAEPRT